MAFEKERIEALLRGDLPAALEERLRNLDRLSGEAARGMEDLGQRASLALDAVLRRGGDVEDLLQRLAVALREQVLDRTVLGPVERAVGGGLETLLPGAGALRRIEGTFGGGSLPVQGPFDGQNPITINVSAPGGDPAQVRRSMGRAASELARIVERGRRY